MISASALRQLAPWAAQLSDAEREYARQGVTLRAFSQGSFICCQNQSFNFWACVSDGLLKLRTLSPEGKEVVLVGMHAGGWFGEGSVIRNEPRRYDAVALRDTTLALMDRPTFMRLFEDSPAFSHFLVHQINERLAQFMGLVEHDRMLSPTARVARGLASLLNQALYPEVGRELDITQEEVGLLAGVSRPVANQALKTLHNEGLLALGRGGIAIHDLERLQNYG